MKPSRIQAIDHIRVEAPHGLEEELIDFYTEIGGLEYMEEGEADSATLCFRSAQLRLHIRMVDNPRVDSVARRMTLAVDSLEAASRFLEERSVPYLRLPGLWYTDRRLSVCDPAGHRVELKQQWPLL
jgi:hypothetical protein